MTVLDIPAKRRNLAHSRIGTDPLLHIGGIASVATLTLTPELAAL